MSAIGDMRTAIIDGLGDIAALAGVEIAAAATPDDVWALAVKDVPYIFVIYTGLEADPPQQISPRRKTYACLSWLLVVVTKSYRNNMDAITGDSGADVILEAVRDIRTTPIGPVSNPNIYLRLRSETLAEPPERPEQGGPISYVCHYVTSPHEV